MKARGLFALLLLLLLLLAAVIIVFTRRRSEAQPLELASDPLGPACSAAAASSTGLPPRIVELAVFRDPAVDEAAVTRQLARLARYYQRYAVSFTRRGPSWVLDEAHLIVGDQAAVARALRREGIDPSKPAAGEPQRRARGITCGVALAPLRRFLAQHARPVQAGRVVVVVARRIAATDSALGAMMGPLRGLTLAPDTPLDPALRDCLGVGEPFDATVLLGLDAIEARRPATVDITLAHELGHALGLSHSERAHDLMAVEPPNCVPLLSAEQQQRLR